MDSPGGLVQAQLQPDGLVAVAMGVPDFEPKSLPFDAPAAAPSYLLDTAYGAVEIGAVSIGNPHAVIRVPSVAAAPVDSVGPAVEKHGPAEPGRARRSSWHGGTGRWPRK
jgi:diaminopimelate epimerase